MPIFKPIIIRLRNGQETCRMRIFPDEIIEINRMNIRATIEEANGWLLYLAEGRENIKQAIRFSNILAEFKKDGKNIGIALDRLEKVAEKVSKGWRI